jgi:hypothetical protein
VRLHVQALARFLIRPSALVFRIALSYGAFEMSQAVELADDTFVDRRAYDPGVGRPAVERRQFTNSYEELSPEARELAKAVDEYKLRHRRRFITYEEMLSVLQSLGYQK